MQLLAHLLRLPEQLSLDGLEPAPHSALQLALFVSQLPPLRRRLVALRGKLRIEPLQRALLVSLEGLAQLVLDAQLVLALLRVRGLG